MPLCSVPRWRCLTKVTPPLYQSHSYFAVISICMYLTGWCFRTFFIFTRTVGEMIPIDDPVLLVGGDLGLGEISQAKVSSDFLNHSFQSRVNKGGQFQSSLVENHSQSQYKFIFNVNNVKFHIKTDNITIVDNQPTFVARYPKCQFWYPPGN